MSGWDTFVHWGARLARDVDLDDEERDYKLETAARLADVRGQLIAGDPAWPEELRRTLQSTNLLNRFFLMALIDDLRADAARMREALLGVWQEGSDLASLDTLAASLRNQNDRYSPGNVLSLGSVLLMARDPSSYPPYRTRAVAKWRRLTGLPAVPSKAPLSERYRGLLEFCDEFLRRAQETGPSLRDRLDVQSLAWLVTEWDPPASWSSADQRALLEWRDGKVPSESRRAWLVRGSSVEGYNLVTTWLAEGWVSLAAAQLRAVEPGTSRRELKEIVDSDYQHKSYAARETKVQEFDAFLNQMKPDDLVVTTSQGRVYLGAISGPPEFVESEGGRSNLRRLVRWRDAANPADFGTLPAPLPAKFGSQADVLDLTEELSLLEGIAGPVDRPPAKELHLPDATDDLSARLLVERGWLQELIELLRDRRQVILYGPPGTGKTYLAQHVARHLTEVEPGAVKLVQFHPSYSYEDFFEGYRPVGGEDGTLSFELRPGPFRRVVEAARQDPSTPRVLIIDEINRANVAKVFGELYFLLEYRDQTIGLQYSAAEDDFTLPPNVFLIGTMNTADRSIALVDTALRRRFAFVSLHPSDEPVRGLLRRWLDYEGLADEPARLLDALNERVADRDYAIGPSYFMRREIYEREHGLERVWRTDIMPLVEELYYGEEGIEERFGLDALRKVIAAEPVEP
ncbi:MAG: McrB family protein [Streptosporangiaceae bacterium]